MNNNNEKNRIAYDKKAGNYDNTLDGKFTAAFKDMLLANMKIRENDCVLDVGCGNGMLLSKISAAHNIQGFGVDISPNMVKYAKVRNPKFNFAVSESENMPFGDNSMNIITVCAAYHHFPNVNTFAREAKRILKPDGRLYIAEVHVPVIIRPIANIFLPFSKDGDVKFYSSKEIVATFSNAGFSFVNTVRKGHVQVVEFLQPVT